MTAGHAAGAVGSHHLCSVFCTLLPVLQAHALSFQRLGSSESSGAERGHQHAAGQ